MDELLAILDSSRAREQRERKFFAAINGVDLDSEEDEESDIVDLKGREAASEGFGINEGLGFMQLGE